RHTRSYGDWSSDVCSSDLVEAARILPFRGDDKVALAVECRVGRAGGVPLQLVVVAAVVAGLDLPFRTVDGAACRTVEVVGERRRGGRDRRHRNLAEGEEGTGAE